MKRNLILAIILPLILIGCVTLPKQYNFKNQKTFEFNFDFVKSKIVNWCIENKINIPSIVTDDKNQLILLTEGDVRDIQGITFSSWDGLHYKKLIADCGKLGLADKGGLPKRAKFNFIINRTGENITTVIINIDYYDTYQPQQIGCNSTGVLEKEILEYIENKVQSTPINP